MILCSALLVGFSAPVHSGDTLQPPAPRPRLVTAKTEKAIESGLQYLLRVRDADTGVWIGDGWKGAYPTASTALVGMALLAGGSTPTRGSHARVLREITDYLVSCSKDYGLFTDPEHHEPRPMYSHAFSMTFLALVLGQESRKETRERVKAVLRKGVELCARTQTHYGGWGYTPNYRDDEGTLVVTQLTALRACRDAGIPVSKKIIDRGVEYIRKSTNANGTVRYRAGGSPYNWRMGVTCAATVALWNAGEYDSELVRKIRNRIAIDIAPLAGRGLWRGAHHGEYIEYYLAQSCWVLGGEEWERYYRTISSYLAIAQSRDGRWVGADSEDYGDIYTTAIALLILQLPYQRLPIFQR